MMAGAQQHRAFRRDWHTRLLHRRVEMLGRDLRARWDMAQIDADTGHDAVFEWIFVDRCAALAEMARRVDMRAAVVRYGKEHYAVAVDAAGLGQRLLVRFPDAMDNRRLPRIGRRAVIKLPAQIDDAHAVFHPLLCVRRSCSTVRAAHSIARSGLRQRCAGGDACAPARHLPLVSLAAGSSNVTFDRPCLPDWKRQAREENSRE